VRDRTEDTVSEMPKYAYLSSLFRYLYVILTYYTIRVRPPANTTWSSLVLLREVEVACDLSQNEQMADSKELTIDRALDSQPICRAQQ